MLDEQEGCYSGCGDSGCVIACSETFPVGKATLRLAPTTIQQLKGFLNRSKKEVGGLLVPNLQTQELVIRNQTGGGKDRVSIPIGMYSFHTHPNRCLTETNCYMDVPSEDDMAMVLRDSSRNLISHVVFAHGGAYVITLQPFKRAEIGGESKRLGISLEEAVRREADRIYKSVKALNDELETQMQPGAPAYGAVRSKWLSTIKEREKDYGFKVEFFPRYEDVRFTVTVIRAPAQAARTETNAPGAAQTVQTGHPTTGQ